MIKIGKHTKVNREANKILVGIYQDLGIMSCEIRLDGCTGSLFLGFAHKHKRGWYWERGRDTLALLSSPQETVLGCTNCHLKIEVNEDLTKEIFKKLRG